MQLVREWFSFEGDNLYWSHEGPNSPWPGQVQQDPATGWYGYWYPLQKDIDDVWKGRLTSATVDVLPGELGRIEARFKNPGGLDYLGRLSTHVVYPTMRFFAPFPSYTNIDVALDPIEIEENWDFYQWDFEVPQDGRNVRMIFRSEATTEAPSFNWGAVAKYKVFVDR